jgi:hypothetical protein
MAVARASSGQAGHRLLNQVDWSTEGCAGPVSVLVASWTGCLDRSEAAAIPREQVKQEQDELNSNCQPQAALALYQADVLLPLLASEVSSELPNSPGRQEGDL